MAINKKLIHFKKFSDFNLKKLSANEQNTQYTLGVDGAVTNGAPEILYQSICWIKDEQKMWTHGTMYSCDEKQFKTVNGKSILGEGNITNYTPINYSELKELRDNSQLIPGMWYRITDYETRVRKTEAYASANHKFDIIVLATSENTLSEEAKALKTDRDWEVESGILTVDFSPNGDGSELRTVLLDSTFFETEVGTNKFLIVSAKGADGSITEPLGKLCYKSGETMVYNDITYYKWYVISEYSAYVLTEKENPDKDDVVIYYEDVQLSSETTENIYYVYDTEKEYYDYYGDSEFIHTSNQLGVGDSFKYLCIETEVLLFDLAHTLDPENYPSELPIIESTGSEGPYFENNNLEAWKLWYTLDNDANKYHWADVDTFGSFEYDGYTWDSTGFSKDVIMIGGMVMLGALELPDTENGELLDIGVKMAETRSNGNFFRITSDSVCVLQQKYDEVTIDGVTYDLVTWPYFYGADPSTASTLTSSTTTIGINNTTVYEITDNVPALMAGYTAEAITDESIIAYSTNQFDNICFTIGRNPADKLIFDTYGLYSSEYYVMEPVTLYEFYSSGQNEIAYANFEYNDSKRFIFYSNGGGNEEAYAYGTSMSGNNMYFYDYDGRINTVLSTASKGDGRGVIYRMIDEFGNDCPYDFKNIVYNMNSGGGAAPNSLSADSFGSTHDAYAYTFSYIKYAVTENAPVENSLNLTDTLTSSTSETRVGIRDLSIVYGKCDNNKIGSYYNYEYEAYDLPLIVFVGSMGGVVYGTNGNVQYYNYDMLVHNNTIGNNCCQLFLTTGNNWGKIQNFEVNSFVENYTITASNYDYQSKKKVVYNDGIEIFEEVAPASESDIQNIVQPQINTLQTNINTTNANLSNLTTRVSNLEANSLTDAEVDTLVTNNLILEE